MYQKPSSLPMNLFYNLINYFTMLFKGCIPNIAEELTSEPYKNAIIEDWYQVSRIISKTT